MGQKTRKKPTNVHVGRKAGSPWPRIFAVTVASVVVVGLAAAVFFSANPVRGVPIGTEAIPVGPAAHVEGDIHEGSEIPAGGEHSQVWQNCGFYDTEVRSENAVHSLEHGAVWITYRPTIGADQIDRLSGLARPDEKILISPRSDQSSPIVATAWAFQVELDDPEDTRLAQFITEFTRGRTAPEPGGRCSGGLG